MASILKIQGAEEKKLGIRYEVDTDQEPIGVGGMGQVFKGLRIDERSGVRQAAAVKFLFDDLPPNAIERSRREASIQIDNENLLKMFGFIQVDEDLADGSVVHHYHVASELLYGVMLSDLLTGVTTGKDGKPIEFAEKLYLQSRQQPEEFARFIVKNLLSGVMALHDKGFIHRDIDPSNIMITADGKVKLIDFGIAKRLSEVQGEKAHLTMAGQFMGKAAYASPELVLGDVTHEDPTTDLYAVGIVLFQLLTGHLPFDGPRQEVLEAQLKTPPPVAQIKDRKMRAIVSKALAKKQADRYQSAAEFRTDLEHTVVREKTDPGSAPAFKKPAAVAKAPSASAPNWKLIGGIAAGVIVIAGIVLALALPKKPKSVSPPAAVMEEPEMVRDTTPSAVWYTQEAIAKLQSGQASEGVDLLNKAIDKDSTSSALANAIMASLYSHEGACEDLGIESPFEIDYQKAYDLSRKAVEQDSTCYYAHYELAYSYVKRYDQIIGGERDARKGFWHLRACERWAANKDNTQFAEEIQSRLE